MISPVFTGGRHAEIASDVLQRLRSRDLRVPAGTESSGPAADVLERAVGTVMVDALGEDCAGGYEATTGQRSREDLRFVDRAGYRHSVNVKGQDLGKDFHMPNLISADNLRKFFAESLTTQSHYSLLIVRYRVSAGVIEVVEVLFFPIEWVRWHSLAIQSQGRGMVQLKNGLRIDLDPGQRRTAWVAELIGRHAEYHEALSRKAAGRATAMKRELDSWRKACQSGTEACPATVGAGQIGIFD